MCTRTKDIVRQCLHADGKLTDLKLRELERRLQPKTRKDFEILYSELECWRREERIKIEEKDSSAENKKLMACRLLEKETWLLRKIDRLRVKAMDSWKCKRRDTILALMSQPKQWELSNGDLAKVHTPFTTRAMELKHLYETLIDYNLNGEKDEYTSYLCFF